MTLAKLIKGAIGGGVLLSLASVSAVSAASIPSLFSTGVDGAGNALAPGALDPHYVVVGTGNNAVTISSLPFNYVANNATSMWIWEQPSGQPTWTTRTLRTTFDLTGFDLSTTSIKGRWAADDFLDDILINGVSIGPIPNYPGDENFNSLHPFTISSGFATGINTLDFVVRDTGNVAGFRVDFTPVPEPSAVLGLVLLGFGAFLKRR